MNIVERLLDIKLPKGKSAFLWGPRKVGKSYWIRQHLPKAVLIDFLKTDVFAEYITRPALLLEVKSSKRIHEQDAKTLRLLQSECTVKKALLIGFEAEPKSMGDGIEYLPWRQFLDQLWAGDYF